MANYIQAIKNKLTGQRDIEIADLEVYLKSQVAIGEHPNIGEEIENKISTIDSLQSKIETIDKLFPNEENNSVESEES